MFGLKTRYRCSGVMIFVDFFLIMNDLGMYYISNEEHRCELWYHILLLPTWCSKTGSGLGNEGGVTELSIQTLLNYSVGMMTAD